MSNPTFTKDRRKSTDVPQDAQANSQAQANLAPSPMGVSLDLTPLKKPIRPVKKPARAESDLEPVPGPVIFDAVTEQPLLLAQAQSAPPLLLAQAQNEVAGREFPSLFGAPVTSTTNESFKAIDASGPRNLTGFGLSDVALVAGSVVLAAASGGGGGANANSTGSGSGSPAPTVLPPVFQTIAVRNNLSGTATVDVTYSTKLDSQHPPLLSAFKLSKGGIDYTPNKIAISGNVISLDFYHVVVGTQAQALPFSYTGPGSDNSAQALLGSSGLPAADLLTTVVAVDNTPPTVTAVSVRALSANPQATVINGQADFTVTFSEGLSGTAPTAANFSAGAYATVTGVTPVANTTQYLVRVITKANVPSGTVALRLIGAGLSDAAGNAVANADLTSLAALAVDTVAPVVSISSVGGADSTVKALASDHAVVGTAEVGRPVTIKTGANTLGTATADASGHWSYMLTTANISTLGQGSNKSITASQTDVAGNVGTSAVFKFSVDTVAPTVIAVTDNVSASMTNGWVVFTVTFSEALVGTVTTANFTAGPNGTVTDVITVTGANQCIVRVKPNAGVASGTVGLSVVGGGLSNASGNALLNADLTALDSQAVDTVAPTFTSSPSVSVAENTKAGTTVYSARASDQSAVTYSLTGTDAACFAIDASTGAVSFKASPDFENPTNAAANNVYAFTVVATDAAGNAAQQDVSITVTNVNEAPAITSGLLSTSLFEVADAPASTATTYTLLPGQSLQGTINSGDDDWYKVRLTGGLPYTFAMTGVGPKHLSDTYLKLRDSSGALLASNDDGLPSFNSIISYTPSIGGDYYLEALPSSGNLSGDYSLTYYQGNKPSFSASMGAGVMDTNYSWGIHGTSATVTYGFRQTTVTGISGTHSLGTINCQLTTAEITAVEQAMQFWSDVCGLTFTRVNPGGYTDSATMLIANYQDSNDSAAAYSYFPATPDTSAGSNEGDLWLNIVSGGISTTNLAYGTYSFSTIVHELGHTLGLSHPGKYGAVAGLSFNYANNAQFIQDTDQYTDMTYFSVYAAGASKYPTTPMMFDILAAQNIYGVNHATRSGDTVYGFNSNAGDGDAYLFSGTSASSAFCIWDGGGNDTLDCSGFAQPQFINLGDGTFSDVGGNKNNVSIAVGCTIENAKGGVGNDLIFGNAVDNVITGGGGNDFIFGGGGTDTAVFAGNYASFTISPITDGWQITGADGTKCELFNIEFAQFSDQKVALASNAPYVITSLVKVNLAQNFSNTTVYTATATDVDANTSLTYVLGGLDAGLFNINTTTGAVSFKTHPNYAAPTDFGADNTYNITVRAFDGGLYSDAQEVAIRITNTIDLGTYGKLINPVQVNGGKTYFFWDRNGDGIGTPGDVVDHDTLDALFNQDVSGNTGGGGNTTDTYRFATLNGFHLALPTLGTTTALPAYLPGTSVGDSVTAANGSNAINATYDDLSSVWDAFNGSGTQTDSTGIPTGWAAGNYWTATNSASGHALLSLKSGYASNYVDTYSGYVALQVVL